MFQEESKHFHNDDDFYSHFLFNDTSDRLFRLIENFWRILKSKLSSTDSNLPENVNFAMRL